MPPTWWRRTRIMTVSWMEVRPLSCPKDLSGTYVGQTLNPLSLIWPDAVWEVGLGWFLRFHKWLGMTASLLRQIQMHLECMVSTLFISLGSHPWLNQWMHPHAQSPKIHLLPHQQITSCHPCPTFPQGPQQAGLQSPPCGSHWQIHYLHNLKSLRVRNSSACWKRVSSLKRLKRRPHNLTTFAPPSRVLLTTKLGRSSSWTTSPTPLVFLSLAGLVGHQI